MTSLHIVADENIPCVAEAFGHLGQVTTRPGRALGPDDIRGADVLLVRSVTRVDATLFDGQSVEFVGSATIGTDHVDREYLADRDIAFAHAPGSNADSVADYVVAAILQLAYETGRDLTGLSVGIVGCGNIGGRLSHRLPALGLSVLRNDPPRAEAAEADGIEHDFLPLTTVLRDADVLTLHVPLTTQGPHATHHLLGSEALGRLGDNAWLINASRGSVVDANALRNARVDERIGPVVLDVWENEPTPNNDLMRVVNVATPHIAGYAYDGKVRGTTMLYQALCQHLNTEPSWHPETALRPTDRDTLRCSPPDPRLPKINWLHRLAQQAYDLRADDERMRTLLEQPAHQQADVFRDLRKTYPRRREMQRHIVPASTIPAPYEQAVTEGLTIQSGQRT